MPVNEEIEYNSAIFILHLTGLKKTINQLTNTSFCAAEMISMQLGIMHYPYGKIGEGFF